MAEMLVLHLALRKEPYLQKAVNLVVKMVLRKE